MKKNQEKKARRALVLRLLAGSVVFAFAFTHTEPLGPWFGGRTSGAFTSAVRRKIGGFYNTQKMRMGQFRSTYGQRMAKTFDTVSALSNTALTGYIVRAIGTSTAFTIGLPALLASSALAAASKKMDRPYLFNVPYKSVLYLAGLQTLITYKTVNPTRSFVKNFTPITPALPKNMNTETKNRIISVSKSLGSLSKNVSQQVVSASHVKQNPVFKWSYGAAAGLSYAAWLLSPKTKKIFQKHPALTNGVRTALDSMKQKPLVSNTCNLIKNSRSLRSTFKFVRNPKVTLAIYGLYGVFEWARLGKKYWTNVKQYCQKRWRTYKQSEA